MPIHNYYQINIDYYHLHCELLTIVNQALTEDISLIVTHHVKSILLFLHPIHEADY